MKKYRLIVFIFVLGLFLVNTNSANALIVTTGDSVANVTSGCSSVTSGYNTITGESCIKANSSTFTSSNPACENGYDTTTGFSCGCSAATDWLTNKGEYCGTVQPNTSFTDPKCVNDHDLTTGFLCGCSSSSSGFSGTTGKSCIEKSVNASPDSIYFNNSSTSSISITSGNLNNLNSTSTCLISGYDQNTGLLCGCSSASGFSTTTGISCGLYPLGCNSSLGVSVITGRSCGVTPVINQTNSNISSNSSSSSDYDSTTGLPYGCSSASGFSITTGKPCGSYPLGCTSSFGFSVITGISCGVLSVTTSPSSSCMINRTLRRGSTGTDVACLQKSLGSDLVPDGKFGPKTYAAVKAFQASVPGLVVDGIVGPKTTAALKLGNFSSTCTIGRTLKRGLSGTDVACLQKSLGSDLVPDGKFGPKTYAAVKAFQTSAGLVVDGIVGTKTTTALKLGRY